MLKKLLKNLILVVGTYTLVTKTPAYVEAFVHGAKSGWRGENLETALKSYNQS